MNRTVFACRVCGIVSFLLCLTAGLTASAQPGTVLYEQKISENQGGFTGVLDDDDQFGVSTASLGDLDGDGIGDMAVGAWKDTDGGAGRGAVWILFLNIDGTVKAHQKISATEGGFTGVLEQDGFGFALSSMKDFDGDGLTDIAVGAPFDDDGVPGFLANRGAVWILLLNSNGTVKGHQKISEAQGGFTGVLDDFDNFGRTVSSLGDLDGDGVTDIAVGAPSDDDGGADRGAAWILFLNNDGTVKSHQKISDTDGNFTGTLVDSDVFGSSVEGLGDLDGDGTKDVVSAAVGDGANKGALWILFLNMDGTVKSHQKINDTDGGFAGVLSNGDLFGRSLGRLFDMDGDMVDDLAVGATGDSGADGAVWILFLNMNGTVKGHQKINDTEGGFTGPLDGEQFGWGVSSLGDHDGDDISDLAVGELLDSDGGLGHGAVWVLFLDGVPDPTVAVALQAFGSDWAGGHVELTWRLIDVEGDLSFEVLRTEAFDNNFVRLQAAGITREKNQFVFEDHTTDPGTTYRYHVTIFEDREPVASFETTATSPAAMLTLDQNHPNPFNPSTQIKFSIEREAQVRLVVFDVTGKLVTTLVDRRMQAGRHSAVWDGRDANNRSVATGIYFYRLMAGTTTLTRKAALLK